MKHCLHLIIIIIAWSLTGCGGDNSVRQIPHLGDTPYQQDSVLVTYATNPKRALTLLDSALLLGNISDYRSQFIRARIYSKSLVEQQQDSAILICKSLLSHDSVRNNATEQMNIYDMLISTSRIKYDLEAYLQWATKKAVLCQQQGEENERWRTEADIGLVMTQLGQIDEGLAKLDEQRTLDRLSHYEQHAKDYAEDRYRLSWSDNPSDRDRYLDFSRSQAWGFLAQAYAHSDSLQKAKEYLALFDNSGYGKTFMGRRMIAPTQVALGMYDEALTTYDEIERRMAGDTLNKDYATILRSRAIAARAKGHIAEALDFQTRYANLSKIVSDSLHASEAHDYAARYHAQEQQLEIQEKQAEAERSYIVSLAVAIVALLAIAFAIYFFRQKRIVSEKNRALVRMINGTPPEPEEEPDEEEEPEDQSEDKNESADLFHDIDTAIRSERLYKNVNLQRQDICDRFGISRHTLNNLLAEHADGLSFPQYVNNIRLKEALRLLRHETTMTVSAIATEVGFTPANLREQFKRKYGMTPVDYRQNQ